MADIFKTTSDLVLKQYSSRLETVADNEKSIKEEMEGKEDDDGFEDEEIEDEDDDSDDIEGITK